MNDVIGSMIETGTNLVFRGDILEEAMFELNLI